jgi:hypothetical protein
MHALGYTYSYSTDGTFDNLVSKYYMACTRRKDGSGYLRVSGPAGSGLGMISHLRFSGLVLGLVFHPWISNGYSK